MEAMSMKAFWKQLRSRNTLLGLSLIILILPILAACSKNGSNNPAPTATATQTAQSTEQTTTPTPETPKDPVTLTMMGWNIGTFGPVIEKFEEMYPWITIETTNKINGYIIKNVIAGEKVDLILVDNGLSEWMAGDLLVDMKPFVEKDQRIQSAKTVDNLLKSFETGGKQYAMPYSDIPMWIVVNKELMTKYGITMPSNDWTYDEFLEVAKQATNSANGDWGGHGLQQLAEFRAMANGNAAGWRYMNEDSTQSVAHTPGVMADLQWIQELTTKWHIQPNAEEMASLGISANPAEAFLNGNILFFVGADWELEGLKQASFEWDVLPMPKGTVKQATVHQSGSISIPSNSEHIEEAFLFISFLFDIEAQKKFIETGSAAFVKDPALDNYYDEVPIWQGKNVDAIKLSADMCCFSSDPNTVDLGSLAGINNEISTMLLNGGNLSELIPKIEAYNTKAIETRGRLAW